MFRHWVKIYARSPELATQRESLEAACACIDVIMRAKLGNISTGVAAEKLKDAIGVHLKAHVAAYGKDYIKPKHHWTWDVVVQLMRDPVVLDCFFLERHHLAVKVTAQHVKNLAHYERSVLSGSINVQRRVLKTAEARHNTLLGSRSEFPGFPNAEVADKLTYNSMDVVVGDIVFSTTADLPGKVIACAREEGCLMLVVGVMRLRKDTSTWERTAITQVWPASDVHLACAWRLEADASWTVLRKT